MGVRHCAELGKNLQIIMKRLLANQNFCKLLYYTDKDPLSQAEVVAKDILNNGLEIVPKNNPVEEANAKVILVLQNANKIGGNNEFRNIHLVFYIYTPITQWIIKDENLRPFLIMEEIQNSLEGKNINGLGTLRSGDITLSGITQQMTCYTLEFFITDFS